MPTCVDVHLGKRVRLRRKMMGWTQADLGAAINQRFQQIHKYECAVTTISAAMLWKLACALQVEVQFFYEGFQEPRSAEAPAMRSLDERRSFVGLADPAEVRSPVPSPAVREGDVAAMGA